MKLATIKLNPRWGYFALIVLAILIPLLHHNVLDDALEQTRCLGGLMPANYLMLKWLGQLSWWTPVVLFVLFVSSWFRTEANSYAALAVTAITYAIFVTLYAFYAAFLLSVNIAGF